MAKSKNDGNDTFNLGSEPPINENFVQNKIRLETSLLENKYFRWIISIGVAFIFLKVIDTGAELRYIQGQQSAYDKTINTLFDTRDNQLEKLQLEKNSLEKKLLDLERIKFENEKLRFENKRLEEQIKKNK